MVTQEDQKSGPVQTVAQFVTDTLDCAGVLYAIPPDVQAAMFGLAKVAGFRVSGYEVADEEEVRAHAQKFPSHLVLPFIFSSDYQEEDLFAAGWLDSVMKGARLIAKDGRKPLADAIVGAVDKIRPIDPIQFTAPPVSDRLVTLNPRSISYSPQGFTFRSRTTQYGDSLYFGVIGKHDCCAGNLKLSKARNGWSRIVCDDCHLSVPVHVTDANTFGDLRDDIRMRVIGLPPAELPGPAHAPYPPGGRPSVES